MDRSAYTTSTSRGFFSEFSQDTPDFHLLRKLGAPLGTNPYYWYRFDKRTPFFDTVFGPKRVSDMFEFRDALSTVNTGMLTISSGPEVAYCEEISVIVSQVQNRLLNKIRGIDINLGVALGETPQTAEFIAAAMGKVAKSYVQLRRGDVSASLATLTGRRNRNWKDIPGAAANTWLAYCYGLRPLLNDVYGACDAIQKRHRDFGEVKSVKAGRKVNINCQVEHSDGLRRGLIRVNANVSVRGQVRFVVKNPLLKTLDSCGLVNPLSIAWELVPFSFVVDWFFPVGDFITNIVPPQGVDFVDGWTSSHMTGGSICIYTDEQGNEVHGSSIEVLKDRRRLTTFPNYRVTPGSMDLSNQQIMSGIALLTQALVR